MQLFSWLRERMTGRPRTRRAPARGPAPRFRPHLETLEGRDLPSFAAPVAYPVSQPLAVVAADVNGDGKPDLITLAEDGGSVSVRLNLKQGGFGTAQTFVAGGQTAVAMAVGDVSGDGKPDIVLANTDSSGGYPSQGVHYTGSVYVLLGDGKGGFKGVRDPVSGLPVIQNVFQGPVVSLALAHLYDGSETDIVGVTANGRSVVVARPVGQGSVRANHATGLFGGAQSYYLPLGDFNPVPCELAVGDVNADGKPDIVVTEPNSSSVKVLLNNGTGTLGPAQDFAVGGPPTSVALGDVNGDGKLDIVTANSNGTVSVLSGLGNGLFGPSQSYAIGGPATSVALGDFNHDGKLDIVTTGGTEMDLLLNNGSGTFGAYQKVGPAGASVIAADFNGDGYADLAEILGSVGIDVLLNDKKW
jgi:hypothetical protein